MSLVSRLITFGKLSFVLQLIYFQLPRTGYCVNPSTDDESSSSGGKKAFQSVGFEMYLFPRRSAVDPNACTEICKPRVADLKVFFQQPIQGESFLKYRLYRFFPKPGSTSDVPFADLSYRLKRDHGVKVEVFYVDQCLYRHRFCITNGYIWLVPFAFSDKLGDVDVNNKMTASIAMQVIGQQLGWPWLRGAPESRQQTSEQTTAAVVPQACLCIQIQYLYLIRTDIRQPDAKSGKDASLDCSPAKICKRINERLSKQEAPLNKWFCGGYFNIPDLPDLPSKERSKVQKPCVCAATDLAGDGRYAETSACVDREIIHRILQQARLPGVQITSVATINAAEHNHPEATTLQPETIEATAVDDFARQHISWNLGDAGPSRPSGPIDQHDVTPSAAEQTSEISLDNLAKVSDMSANEVDMSDLLMLADSIHEHIREHRSRGKQPAEIIGPVRPDLFLGSVGSHQPGIATSTNGLDQLGWIAEAHLASAEAAEWASLEPGVRETRSSAGARQGKRKADEAGTSGTATKKRSISKLTSAQHLSAGRGDEEFFDLDRALDEDVDVGFADTGSLSDPLALSSGITVESDDADDTSDDTSGDEWQPNENLSSDDDWPPQFL